MKIIKVLIFLFAFTGNARAQMVVDTFYFTGTQQIFIVPTTPLIAIDSIQIDVRGSQGASGVHNLGIGAAGGNGGRVYGNIYVTFGDTIYIYVGGTSGFNGGGNGNTNLPNVGGNGGGASDIRQGGNGLNNRIVVAGGGGGGGAKHSSCGSSNSYGAGGSGGGLSGNNGVGDCCSGDGGGDGAIQISGGNGGVSGSNIGFNGTLGFGGNSVHVSGGGGGGFYGGGGGAGSGSCVQNYGGGGGGGSSLVPFGCTTISGFQSGDGLVIISYDTCSGSSFSADISKTNVTCFDGNNGTAIAMVSGGILPYSYQWSNGQTTQIATGLIAGNYSVTITCANGCTRTEVTNISQPTSALTTVTVTNTPSGCNPPNGTATANTSGGILPYTFLWSDGQPTQTAIGLAAGGTYFVTISDSWGCSIIGYTSMPAPNTPMVYISSVNPVNCNGICNGSAGGYALGGTPPYSFQWSTVPVQTTNIATGLCAGVYTLSVVDNWGCVNINSATVTILQPSQLTVSLTPSTATCGNSDGNITTITNGGIAPYSYQWSNGIVTANVNNLIAGTYSVSVSDFYNCITSDSAQVDLFTNSIPVCLVSVDSTSTKNNIIWEKPIVTNISSFNIYREIASTFTFIATVPYASQSVFTDITNGVNPNTTAYKYEITVIDTCGNESEFSNYHRTIHVATSPASPCGYNLIWNDYIGFPVTQYLIYRDSSNTGWVKMDSVSFGNTSWTDTTCFTGNDTIAYLVEAIKSDGCFPSKANGQNSTRSNVQRNYSVLVPMVFGNNTNIEIYPNPTNGKLYVHIKGLKSSKTIYSLSIDNALGEIIYKSEIKSEKSFVDLSGKPSGIYLICIKSGDKIYRQKIIKE